MRHREAGCREGALLDGLAQQGKRAGESFFLTVQSWDECANFVQVNRLAWGIRI
jgi:hypothetical protein